MEGRPPGLGSQLRQQGGCNSVCSWHGQCPRGLGRIWTISGPSNPCLVCPEWPLPRGDGATKKTAVQPARAHGEAHLQCRRSTCSPSWRATPTSGTSSSSGSPPTSRPAPLRHLLCRAWSRGSPAPCTPSPYSTRPQWWGFWGPRPGCSHCWSQTQESQQARRGLWGPLGPQS